MTLRTNRITLPDLNTIKAERQDKAKANEQMRLITAAEHRANIEPTRKKEQVAETKRRKEKDRRIKADVANLKVDPIMGRSPTGQPIRVDGNSGPGRILALHNQQPNVWKKEMADAAGKFGRDYDMSEFRGLSGMGLEPKVDSSGSMDVAATGIIARMRLRELHKKIGEDGYAMLVLVCGVGFTFTDLHGKGLGDKRTLSERLRVALNKAAHHYALLKEEPVSDFLTKAHRLITDIKNSV
jgi:hypothetical protein